MDSSRALGRLGWSKLYGPSWLYGDGGLQKELSLKKA
jgi:hypothetical protein